MLINKFLPGYHFHEIHSIKVNGFRDGIYQSMLQCNFAHNKLIKFFFRLRGIRAEAYTIEQLPELGFIKLHEEPGKEVIFGMITDSPVFSSCQSGYTPTEFIKNLDPAKIKAVINFKVQQVNNSEHIISTETRVLCGSKAMKSKFRYYWFFVKPFSQLIRKSMLRQMRQEIISPIGKNVY